MNKSYLPGWFNIWWIINICLAAAFLIYWFLIDFKSNNLVFVFIIYSNLWGLWAAQFRRKNKLNQKDKLVED
jgi:membrane protein implicated in regulation of membrane protease activity